MKEANKGFTIEEADKEIENFSKIIEENMDMDLIYKMIKEEK